MNDNNIIKSFVKTILIGSHNETSKIYLYRKTRMFIGFIDNKCIAYKQTVFMTWDNFFGKY